MEEILPLLRSNTLLQKASESLINQIAGAMMPEQYAPGSEIIRYGDSGTHYYILAKGQVKVIVYQPGTAANDKELENKVLLTKTMDAPVGFGELALIYNDKRSATIIASD